MTQSRVFVLFLHMIIPFLELANNSRIWIYPSSRKFYDSEISNLKQKVETFLEGWLEDEVKCAFQLKYNRFLVFGTEKEAIITSEIDQLVAFILQLQSDYKVELLDRMNACFKQGEYVQYKELKEFQKLIKQKAVSKKTIVFDNLLESKKDFDSFWEIPISESWYSRFLK